ncbi:hypothetical protein L1887_10542 [Cichorium endivia]|nr:hypothetical protein L1887_10542 [Cichorium endivia]
MQSVGWSNSDFTWAWKRIPCSDVTSWKLSNLTTLIRSFITPADDEYRICSPRMRDLPWRFSVVSSILKSLQEDITC